MDPAIVEYVNGLEQEIVSGPSKHDDYQVVDNGEFNAFSPARSLVYVNAGLILDSQNEAPSDSPAGSRNSARDCLPYDES